MHYPAAHPDLLNTHVQATSRRIRGETSHLPTTGIIICQSSSDVNSNATQDSQSASSPTAADISSGGGAAAAGGGDTQGMAVLQAQVRKHHIYGSVCPCCLWHASLNDLAVVRIASGQSTSLLCAVLACACFASFMELSKACTDKVLQFNREPAQASDLGQCCSNTASICM